MANGAIFVVMGVAGSGKSTIGRLLADELGVTYAEADDFHSRANIATMARGQALTDVQREPWLAAIAAWILDTERSGRGGVISCSALKRAYRDRLRRGGARSRLVYLKADEQLIRDRLAHRTGHFFPARLIDSQFSALEEPGADEAPIVVSVANEPAQVVREITDEARRRGWLD